MKATDHPRRTNCLTAVFNCFFRRVPPLTIHAPAVVTAPPSGVLTAPNDITSTKYKRRVIKDGVDADRDPAKNTEAARKLVACAAAIIEARIKAHKAKTSMHR